MKAAAVETGSRWRDTWLDAIAFVAGLGVAWFAGWGTADLVWSLWLSSLLVGYALIVWHLTALLREFITGAVHDRSPGYASVKIGGAVVLGAGTLFALAFFTVHFGGFHFGHSVFLNHFFPIETGTVAARGGFPGIATYAEVFRRYWIFLPAAFLAERAAFFAKRPVKVDLSVTPEAIARRKAGSMGGAMMAPYKNVIRMHLLIFFFIGAHVLHLDHFIVYVVVYAVYFFPWRMVRGDRSDRTAA